MHMHDFTSVSGRFVRRRKACSGGQNVLERFSSDLSGLIGELLTNLVQHEEEKTVILAVM